MVARSVTDALQPHRRGALSFQRPKQTFQSTPPMGEAEEILACFPGPVILYPSRAKWGSLTIAAACLMLFCVPMALRGDVGGVLTISVFAFAAVTAGIMLVPGANWVRLDAQGFDVTRFFRTRRFVWSQVGDFDVWTFRRTGMVVFSAVTPQASLLARLNAALTRRNASLPDTYGLAPQDLVQLMTAWQNRARTRSV